MKHFYASLVLLSGFVLVDSSVAGSSTSDITLDSVWRTSQAVQDIQKKGPQAIKTHFPELSQAEFQYLVAKSQFLIREGKISIEYMNGEVRLSNAQDIAKIVVSEGFDPKITWNRRTWTYNSRKSLIENYESSDKFFSSTKHSWLNLFLDIIIAPRAHASFSSFFSSIGSFFSNLFGFSKTEGLKNSADRSAPQGGGVSAANAGHGSAGGGEGTIPHDSLSDTEKHLVKCLERFNDGSEMTNGRAHDLTYKEVKLGLFKKEKCADFFEVKWGGGHGDRKQYLHLNPKSPVPVQRALQLAKQTSSHAYNLLSFFNELALCQKKISLVSEVSEYTDGTLVVGADKGDTARLGVRSNEVMSKCSRFYSKRAVRDTEARGPGFPARTVQSLVARADAIPPGYSVNDVWFEYHNY